MLVGFCGAVAGFMASVGQPCGRVALLGRFREGWHLADLRCVLGYMCKDWLLRRHRVSGGPVMLPIDLFVINAFGHRHPASA